MMLRVSPSADSVAIDDRMASGIDVAMITVERQLPRNSRIIRLVNAAAMIPSRATPLMAERTNSDWSPIRSIFRLGGKAPLLSASLSLIPAMTPRVEAEPVLSTGNSTERLPLTCTMLVCGGLPSRTVATSRINTVVPSAVLIGRFSRSWKSVGELFSCRLNS
eukprot:gene18386-biopygen9893